MIRKILAAVVLVPLTVLLLLFAMANRQVVTVSFDPFDAAQPAYAASLPLFVLIFILAVLGVLIGGIAAWLGQGKWRRAARRLDERARRLDEEVRDLRRRADAAAAAPPPAPSAPPVLPPPL